MNYKLIHNLEECQKFIDFLPALKHNEGYFLILIARKKWFPESDMPSSFKLKRECVNTKEKIIHIIRQWEVAEGCYRNEDKIIHQNNLGVYIGYNPKDHYEATFELAKKCLNVIKTKGMNVNVKSMANDIIQSSNGTKNFIDIDVDIKEGEDYKEIKRFIEDIINPKYLTFVKTNGGFHCLISLKRISFVELASQYGEFDNTKEQDFSTSKDWYQRLQKHPFKSELNIMSNDLMPVAGCNQGQFIPYIFK